MNTWPVACSKIGGSFKKVVVTGDVVPAQYDDRGIPTINVYGFPSTRKRENG